MKAKEVNNNNTLVRLIIMIVVMANSIGTMYGYSLLPFTEDQITHGISAVALVASEIWNHYRNNDYSDVARQKTNEMKQLKKQKNIK